MAPGLGPIKVPEFDPIFQDPGFHNNLMTAGDDTQNLIFHLII